MISVPTVKDKIFYVVGLARSGTMTADVLRAAGATVYVFDDAQEGGTVPDDVPWEKVSALVLSPGIPHIYPQPHAAADLARHHHVPIICDVDLLAQACPKATYVAITGTNGKSTTTALIHHMLVEQGKGKVQVGGNIGLPVLGLEPALSKDDIFVLELSSYQLERTPHLKPDVAVWMNITPDHIDRHGDLEGYIAAKKNIFTPEGNPQCIVMSIDDVPSQLVWKGLQQDRAKTIIPVSVGRLLEDGLSVIDGMLYDHGKKIMALHDHPSLFGVHNYQNMAMAYGVLKALKVDFSRARLHEFAGLAHRQEVVAQEGLVTYINDSKATNMDSTARALEAFDHIYLLAGGVAKEGGLSGIGAFAAKIHHTFVYGQAAPDFAAQLGALEMSYTVCHTLEEALVAARAQALASSEKTMILLSPACASFDQFADFAARGDHFRRLVQSIVESPEVQHG